MIGLKMFFKSKVNILFIIGALVTSVITSSRPDEMYWYTSKLDPYMQDISFVKLTCINYFLILFFYGVLRVIIETGKALFIRDGE